MAEENASEDSSDDDDAKSPDSERKPKMRHLDTNGHEVQPSGHTHLANTMSNRNLSDVDEHSMTPAETPNNPSDSDDNGSVDSISTDKLKEIEKRNSMIIHDTISGTGSDGDAAADAASPSSSPNPFADNFDDVAAGIVNKYNSMDPPQYVDRTRIY